MSSSLAFSIFCGRCFRQISLNSDGGGSVLSCSDFLCSSCAQVLATSSSCPACGKHGVRAAFLNDSLPIEVKQNIEDPTREFEKILNTLEFQTSHYRNTIKRLLVKLQSAEQEIQKKNAYIKELESKLHQKQTQQPFFMSKDSDQRSETIEGLHEFQPKQRSSYFTNHISQPRTSTHEYATTSLPNQLPLPPARVGGESPLPTSYIPGSPAPKGNIHDSETEKLRRRIFTPSRAVFDPPTYKENQFGSTPSRIRSPHIPMVRSPTVTSYQQVPLRDGEIRSFRSGQNEHLKRREVQSPISSFIRQTFH